MRSAVPLLGPVTSTVLGNIMFVHGSVRRLEVVKGLNDNFGEHLAVYTVLMRNGQMYRSGRLVRYIYAPKLGIGT